MDHEVIETPLAKRSCLYTAMVRRDSKPDNAATGRGLKHTPDFLCRNQVRNC
jgi:hypothetical protein